MFHRYSFLVLFGFLISGLSWWAQSLETNVDRGPAAVAQEDGARAIETHENEIGLESQRREALEVLDRLVAYEQYYHSVYGHFTKLLNRLGYSIPKAIASVYEIRVTEATTERLLINALSEIRGKTSDVVSVDQDFKIHASFPIPKPRSEFLRYRALRHLRLLWEAPSGQIIEEQGVFKEYFKYEVRRDSRDQKIAFAVGTRYPVLGLQLEYGPLQAAQDRSEQGPASELGLEFAQLSPAVTVEATGQRSLGALMSSSEEAFLAQRIFRGEVGRYAKTWTELSKIANFDFESHEKSRVQNLIDLTPSSSELQGKINPDSILEIEPISSEK